MYPVGFFVCLFVCFHVVSLLVNGSPFWTLILILLLSGHATLRQHSNNDVVMMLPLTHVHAGFCLLQHLNLFVFVNKEIRYICLTVCN